MSPNDRSYTQEHEWIIIEDAEARRALVGITDYAQSELGDIVYFELPKVGDTLTHLGKMGEVESVKAVSDLFSPVSGEVIEVNGALVDQPELTNTDPFGAGLAAAGNHVRSVGTGLADVGGRLRRLHRRAALMTAFPETIPSPSGGGLGWG